MPLDKTFWAEAFGMVVDKFGTHWMISGGQPIRPN
jgi:PhnB protein